MSEVNYDESKVPAYSLPPLLVAEDGSAVTTAFDWENKRKWEIIRLLQDEMFGEIPPRPEICTREVLAVKEDALNDTAIRKEIKLTFRNGDRSFSFIMLLYIPKNVTSPVPVYLGLNFKGNHSTTVETDVIKTGYESNGELAYPDAVGAAAGRWEFEETIKRGYASATVAYTDIYPNDYDINTWPEAWHKSAYNLFYADESNEQFFRHTSSISCWAWGLSRMLDALENEPMIDCRRAIVHGHSRLGKTALWAGANDQRFRLVISNDSGCCGAALHRRVFGETIQQITDAVPYWFVSSFKKYCGREAELPFDQHFLVALSAPRPVCVASATEDLWADPKGEFLSALHASEVYKLFGVQGLPVDTMPEPDEYVTGEVSYHLRTGKHDQNIVDWRHYWDLGDKFVR